MSARAVRSVVLVVCGLGIVGMIVTSILGHNGAAVAFGLVTAAAVLCSMVATAVANGTPAPATAPAGGSGSVDERQAALVEDLVQELVAAGADEDEVRRLVRQAVRLGRGDGAL
jgi:hypothetical protein